MVSKEDTCSLGLAVEQSPVVIPDVTVKELLDAIPSHCFERSTFKSSLYLWAPELISLDILYFDYKIIVEPSISAHPRDYLHRFAQYALWSIYGFWAGLFMTGLWIIAHECGHHAFSPSNSISDSVGWVLHSSTDFDSLGVPYFSWRITHAQHHASAGHMTRDQVHVPFTRSDFGLAPFDRSRGDILGSYVTNEMMKELWEVMGDTPITALIRGGAFLLSAMPLYLTINFHGQTHYPKWTNHFDPNAVMFKPHQFRQIIWSNIGIALWLAALTTWACKRGVWEVLSVYGIPYLWTNHWIVLLTFLQHTDPMLPRYRGSEFTFARGALATYDRSLLGDCGKLMAWIGAHATHGNCENHVLHHVSSKIPHYNAWEASVALKKFLQSRGIQSDGLPVGWAEGLHVFRECKFVEDEGDIVFYKNSQGIALAQPMLNGEDTCDKITMAGKPGRQPSEYISSKYFVGAVNAKLQTNDEHEYWVLELE
ncbi:hypothetical protein NP233_g40 [Leucocoprinus birnbaumii]|uniref:Fatty acid desaturase domain-containing protein n=1 Tax=Leucocoprinus birnbaumii TaxID=56174 RepID=A0AAD5W2Q2_9AGAR|nr:hypothetical protein NP233_g40 [Leucocoprinus birnbaumii]